MITLDEPPETLRPDLSATADIITAQRTSVVAVPIISMTVRDSAGNKLDAATDDEEEDAPVAGPRTPRTEFEGVFVVSGDTATFVPVKVGITGEQYFEVLSGLEGGETVVSGTYQTIRELVAGDAVRTAKEDTGAAK
jgi:HlyD family secretion protein